MGKQKRTKSKRGNKQRNKSASSASVVASPGGEEKGVSAVVSKIRHGDPRVRHAALVALSSTLFHSSSLSAAARQKQQQKQNSRTNNTSMDASDETLLRALSEKILDVDIPCATAATGCLSNYVSFYCVDGADVISSEAEVASEVMVPILIQRIQRSLDKISSLGSQIESSIMSKTDETAASASASGATGSSAADKLFAMNTEQWVLVSLSLQTLAGLIENFPSAVERISATSLSTLCAVLPIVGKSILLTKSNLADSDSSCILDASTNASRAIHSLLDDNVNIISSIQPTSLAHIVQELTNTITNVEMPHMTRLHASGSVVSLRKVLVLEEQTKVDNTVVAAVKTCTDETVISLLSSLFEVGDHNNEAKQIVLKMIELSNKCQSMKQDEMMESQIVSEVNARKEPARLIARRQKEMKESKKAKAKSEGNENESMAVDGKDDKEASELRLDDVKDELDGVVRAWRELSGSYKLALELVANVCSGREEQYEEEDVMYPDDDEHMWDSDDEAKLMSSANAASDMNSMDVTFSPSERQTFESLSSKQLLERILCFFRSWVVFLPVLKEDVPTLVAEDVDELLSTCALCLGNMIACELSCLEAPCSKKVVIGGKEVLVTNGTDSFWWELVASLSSDVSDCSKAHIISVMLSILRRLPKTRNLVNSDVLNLLLSLVSKQYSVEGGAHNVQMKCHAICVLGLLCSEPHPSEVDALVCSTLVERLRAPLSSMSDDNDADSEKTRQSVLLMHEIFNVLMDMYGGDDSYVEVFNQQDVLGHFQRCLPGFKRRIKKTGAISARDELDAWNETALNCSRFIKYMKER